MPRFMFGCLPQGDHVQVIPTLRIGHLHHLVVQPPEQADALLSVRSARILSGNDWIVEDLLTVFEIEPVAAEIGLTLALIPRSHTAKCSYRKRLCQASRVQIGRKSEACRRHRYAAAWMP